MFSMSRRARMVETYFCVVVACVMGADWIFASQRLKPVLHFDSYENQLAGTTQTFGEYSAKCIGALNDRKQLPKGAMYRMS